MSYLLRFSAVYLVVIVSIFSFYYTITQQSRDTLKLIVKEKEGLVYLEELYQLIDNIMEYKHLVTVEPLEERNELQKVVKSEITTVLKIRQEKFNLQDDSLEKLLCNIKTFDYSNEMFQNLLEELIQEIYLLGDRSGLLFQSERKMFFLNAMLTHNLPEYIISLSITRNIVSNYLDKQHLTDEQYEIYIEQRNLLALSAKELNIIIGLIDRYDVVKPLSKLMPKILKKIEVLPNDFKSADLYLEQLTRILLLSYRLNNESIRVVNDSYRLKEEQLNHKILYNTTLLGFILFVITGLFIYFKSLYASDRKKEEDIKSMAQTLNRLVLYAKTDKEGKIVDISDALVSLSGFKKEKFLGKIHPVFRLKNFPEGKKFTVEMEEFTAENLPYWLHLTLIPEYDKKAQLSGYVLYGVDITYQKEIEVEKQKTQEALSFKSKFLSNMSHEIRTPLNGIIGFTDIVLKSELTVSQKDILNNIKKTSDLLLGIINDILDISKIESGKMTIESRDFNLKELLDNISSIITPKAEEKAIALEVDYSDLSYDNYRGDVLRISQVLSNLLSNAIKFTQEGYVKLSVHPDGSDALCFSVEDTGIGLKKESLSSLFEEFTQADMSTSRKYGGTGLGLSISKNLVALMGGKLEVESEFGKGSKFSFSLKLEVSQEQESKRSEILALDALEEKINNLQGIKILVAEDNKMNQMVLEMLLEESRLELSFADDGAIAVSMYREGDYDLILMDLQMPNLDGYEATKEIRKFDSDVPIIALSANVMQEDTNRAIESGMNNHLAKPIEVEKLYTFLLEYLKI